MQDSVRNVLACLANVSHDTDDELARGFQDATDLCDHEDLRLAAIATHGRYWSPERLAGFLMQHEVFSRNARGWRAERTN